MDTKLG